MRVLPLALLALATTAAAATLGQVRDRADQILGSFWRDDLLPAQQAYFAGSGGRTYYQCLVTGNIPNTTSAAGTVAELIGENRNATLHDFPETCAEVIPALDTQKPFVLYIDVFESATHHGFVARIFAAHNGTVYTRSRCYGRRKSDGFEGVDEGCEGQPSENWRQARIGEERSP